MQTVYVLSLSLWSVSDNVLTFVLRVLQVYESKVTYDSGTGSLCSISSSNEGRVCQVRSNTVIVYVQVLQGVVLACVGGLHVHEGRRRTFLPLLRDEELLPEPSSILFELRCLTVTGPATL